MWHSLCIGDIYIRYMGLPGMVDWMVGPETGMELVVQMILRLMMTTLLLCMQIGIYISIWYSTAT